MRSDQNNQQARYLRNRLIIASLTAVLIGGLIAVTQWLGYAPAYLVLPDGWEHTGLTYTFVVMVFGCVGALLSAIPAVSRIPLDYSPFNLPLQQAIVKLVLGPLFAVIGLLIVGGKVTPIDLPPKLTSQLVLAIVFGAGQQAITQFVDERAKKVLSTNIPSVSSL